MNNICNHLMNLGAVSVLVLGLLPGARPDAATGRRSGPGAKSPDARDAPPVQSRASADGTAPLPRRLPRRHRRSRLSPRWIRAC